MQGMFFFWLDGLKRQFSTAPTFLQDVEKTQLIVQAITG